MLWPPPKRGDSVTLACGCVATVSAAWPVAFLYWICVSESGKTCRRAHQVGSRRIARLESMVAPADRSQESPAFVRLLRVEQSGG